MGRGPPCIGMEFGEFCGLLPFGLEEVDRVARASIKKVGRTPSPAFGQPCPFRRPV
jgi:hypothetical protein